MTAYLHRIAAFCEGTLLGNPAGVCLNSSGMTDQGRQALAAETGYAECAYPVKQDTGWGLRWFTPTTEVDLCGHATLAAAWTLWDQGLAERRQSIFFDTRSGELWAQKQGDWVVLDFPAAMPVARELPGVLSAMAPDIFWCGHDGSDYIIELKDQAAVLALQASDPRWARVESRALVFTARSANREFDIVSRVFAPRSGIPEDPVTGSSHCALAPYWIEKIGKAELMALQASERGGSLKLRLEKDRVKLAGKARRMEEAEKVEL